MDFSKAYRKCRRTQALSRSRAAVTSCLQTITSDFFKVEEVSIHDFVSIDGYKVTTLEGVAFFPKDLSAAKKTQGLQYVADACRSADLVIPPYFRVGFLFAAAKVINDASEDDKQIAGNAFLRSLYTHSDIAQLVTGVLAKRSAFQPYHQQIVECVEAYALGLHHVAITGLLPCIEGLVRQLGVDFGLSVKDDVSIRSLVNLFKRLKKSEVELMFDGYSWIPSEINITLLEHFHERVQMYESISAYMLGRLYLHTDVAPVHLTLNRNGISHGFFTGYANAGNFLRLFNLLVLLSFCAVRVQGTGSMMHPGETEESIKFQKLLEACEMLRPHFYENIRE
jgi:hypothetical protein